MQPDHRPRRSGDAAGPPVTGLRERKKATTRSALRSAALALSRAEGPDAVSVEAICDHAGVSKRTFFNYFASKDDAVLGWSEDEADRLLETVTGRPADQDALAAVEAALADLVDVATTSPIWHAQLDLVRLHPELLGRMTAVSLHVEASVADAVARRAGQAPTHPDVALLAAVTTATLRVVLGRWLDSPEGTDPRRLVGEAFAGLRAGLPIGTVSGGSHGGSGA